MPTGLWVALAFAVGSNEASASALGGLATSTGVFAALIAMLVVKGWPPHLNGDALSMSAAALLVGCGVAWKWRAFLAIWLARVLPLPLRAHRKRQPAGAAIGCPPIALPPGIDAAVLLAELRQQFLTMQAAWDRADMPALRALTTPWMLDELVVERPTGALALDAPRTDVLALRAELLGFEELAQVYLVSINFSGLMRESSAERAAPFRELWMLTKPKHDGGGWRLARHQGLL